MRAGKGQKAKEKELVCYIDQIPKETWPLILRPLIKNDPFAFLRLLMTCKYFNLLKREEALKDSLIYYVSSSELGKGFMLSLHKFCREMKDYGILVPCSVDSNTAKSPIDILVIDLNELKIPEGVDPKKVQHLEIGATQQWGLGAKDYTDHTNELKTFFLSNQFSDLKSVMLYNLEGNRTDVLNSLWKSNLERLYPDKFNFNGHFFKYNDFKSFPILHIISPQIMMKLRPLHQLTYVPIHTSPTTQVKFNSKYSGKDALTFPAMRSSLENLEFTCDPDCQDHKIYLELVTSEHLKELIWKARPPQGKLVLVDFPSELKDVSAYEDSDVLILDDVDRFLSIHDFQEK